MFKRFLKKKDKTPENLEELHKKISAMDLTSMRTFINNKEEITEEGLIEVLKRVISKNETTSKRYIEIDDMDIKIKKSFDLVLSIASNKKITIKAIELIQEFLTVYNHIIEKYDRDNKQIYGSKLKEAVEMAVLNMVEIANIKRKLDFLN
ncbi:MAG: hypothetical protein RBR59_09340 [Sulfurimonadaceae bacterium]|nr:hypothetical protein [Sulfurimonadaceae bacterium]